MRTQKPVLIQLVFSTIARALNLVSAQSKGRQSVTTAASLQSGGHGARTRNPLRGITFPV
jgi:hypothetical protein